jgi:hypothetical protein
MATYVLQHYLVLSDFCLVQLEATGTCKRKSQRVDASDVGNKLESWEGNKYGRWHYG